jgi:hypothetical protein
MGAVQSKTMCISVCTLAVSECSLGSCSFYLEAERYISALATKDALFGGAHERTGTRQDKRGRCTSFTKLML